MNVQDIRTEIYYCSIAGYPITANDNKNLKKILLHSPDVGGLCAQSQHCWVMASWAQVLTTNMKLQPGICPPSCFPVGVCAHQHVCVSIGGRHVANRKVPKKSSLSKQCTTDTGNNVASLRGHNGDVGLGNRRKWAVNYLSSSTVTTERVFFFSGEGKQFVWHWVNSNNIWTALFACFDSYLGTCVCICQTPD